MQAYRAGLGFVRNIRRLDFKGKLAAELGSHAGGFVDATRQGFARDRKSIGGEHAFAGAFGQRSGSGCEPGARRRDVDTRGPC